jgi:hypothetical protein
MPFETLDQSLHLGTLAQLFKFTVGTRVFAYTSFDEPLQHAGVTYESLPITRGPIETSSTLDRTTVDVTIANEAELLSVWSGSGPESRVGVSIFRGVVDDNGDAFFALIWSGIVFNRDIRETNTILTCEPLRALLGRTTYNRKPGPNCPYTLYSPVGCKVNKLDHIQEVIVSTVAGDTVVIPGLTEAQGLALKGGLFSWTHSESLIVLERFIVDFLVESNTVVLDDFIDGIQAGDSAEVARGCAHTLEVCDSEFNNSLNYGGFPTGTGGKNPFNLGLNVIF